MSLWWVYLNRQFLYKRTQFALAHFALLATESYWSHRAGSEEGLTTEFFIFRVTTLSFSDNVFWQRFSATSSDAFIFWQHFHFLTTFSFSDLTTLSLSNPRLKIGRWVILAKEHDNMIPKLCAKSKLSKAWTSDLDPELVLVSRRAEQSTVDHHKFDQWDTHLSQKWLVAVSTDVCFLSPIFHFSLTSSESLALTVKLNP